VGLIVEPVLEMEVTPVEIAMAAVDDVSDAFLIPAELAVFSADSVAFLEFSFAVTFIALEFRVKTLFEILFRVWFGNPSFLGLRVPDLFFFSVFS
jgi:hypothetical protein